MSRGFFEYMRAVVIVGLAFIGFVAGFKESPWWFVLCLPLIVSLIYGARN